MMDFMIGVNYWDSKSGTDMWKHWDAASVEADLQALANTGVRVMRVFPNWRDFQPIHALRRARGAEFEYRFENDVIPTHPAGLSEEMLEHFATFCDLAGKYHISLIPSIVTGWMSGRQFCPPALNGRNHYTDPVSLVWQMRYVSGFVEAFRHRKEILAWDLGNECNVLSECSDRNVACAWTLMIRNAIAAKDSTRPIMSGMHSLSVDFRNQVWRIADQGEFTDVLCPHPYPSPTVGGDFEPMNRLRTTLIPTVQAVLYRGIGKKPSMIQETGTFNDMHGSREVAADFVRINLFSSWAHGALGYLWWCGCEHSHLKNPPYSWSMVERELGLIDKDRKPKPVGRVMRAFGEMLDGLPFRSLPPRRTDGVILLTEGLPSPIQTATGAFVLSKMAGLECEFAYSDAPLPEASLYIVPSINGWAPIRGETWYTLLDRVAQGATLYLSTDTGTVTEFEQVTGLRSLGMGKDLREHTFSLDGVSYPFVYGTGSTHQSGCKFRLAPLDAEILAADEEGNAVLSRHALGKGQVFFSNFPMETWLTRQGEGFTREEFPYYRIYETVAKNLLEKKALRADSPHIGVTLHPMDGNTDIAVLLNYSNEPIAPHYDLRGSLEPIWGDPALLPPCSGCICYLHKEKA
ncbi:MAG: hypothetical protein IJX28_01580 [Clostridia bacterium]|nr:hypothetical protein [Clostridia bacterium]